MMAKKNKTTDWVRIDKSINACTYHNPSLTSLPPRGWAEPLLPLHKTSMHLKGRNKNARLPGTHFCVYLNKGVAAGPVFTGSCRTTTAQRQRTKPVRTKLSLGKISASDNVIVRGLQVIFLVTLKYIHFLAVTAVMAEVVPTSCIFPIETIYFFLIVSTQFLHRKMASAKIW